MSLLKRYLPILDWGSKYNKKTFSNTLAKAGFTNIYNIIDGMEGDGNGDSESVAQGGWKNTGCPWTKQITPDQMVLPKAV